MIDTNKPVLDACCGSRMFWFNKSDDRAVFVDRRNEHHEWPWTNKPDSKIRKLDIKPDYLADFTCLPFDSDSFYLIVFDPPHLLKRGDGSRMHKTYGALDVGWQDMIRAGFAECFRVLKQHGTLVFKWCEYEIPLKEVLALTDAVPLFGHKSGRVGKTHWVTFMKGA